jgi:hypothetical protein
MFWNCIENTAVLTEGLRCLKIKYTWFVSPWQAEVLGNEIAFIFNVNKFKVYQMTQHNTLEK